MPDAVLLHTARHRARRSDGEEGRDWRHDLRALLACRADARDSLDLWEHRKCPALPIHGPESDATTQEAIERVRGCRGVSVIHQLETGQTPSFVDEARVANEVHRAGDGRPFDADLVRPTGDWPRRAL